MDYKAIIFDFDGTLYDFSGIIRRLILSNLSSAFHMQKERMVRKQLKGIDLGTEEKYYGEFLGRLSDLSGNTFDQERDWYNNFYLSAMVDVMEKHYSHRPNLEKMFRCLHKKGIPFAVYSDYPMVRERMLALDVSPETCDLCSKICCAGEFGAQKPAPRPFKEIAGEFGVDAKDVLVIGDRDDTDGQGARNCGMKFIQLKTKKTRVLENTHPIMEWNEVLELLCN